MTDSNDEKRLAAEDAALLATWYEDATVAAHALGLDIALPDVGSADPAYWAALDRREWRDALKGKINMTDEEIDACDPDWVRLKVIPGESGDERDLIEAWFDLEQGVRFRLRVRSAAHLRAIIKQVAALDGLRLSATWPGNVEATMSRFGAGLPEPDEIAPLMEAAG
ncbi:MAG TPA: hypothetical protein VD978_10845 [Azospirillum sp.]|nr:hypothetical protein [Azospirillum sp.]